MLDARCSFFNHELARICFATENSEINQKIGDIVFLVFLWEIGKRTRLFERPRLFGNYNARGQAAELRLDGSKFTTIRKHETYEDLTALGK